MESKFLGKSKTWWFNFISILLVVLGSNEIAQLIPPQAQLGYFKVLATVNAVGNIIIRFFTHGSVTMKVNGKTSPQ